MAKIIYFFIFVLMDESLIYIIILIIIYVVRFFLKKGEEPATRVPQDTEFDYEPTQKPSGPRRPTTFEELLEELGKKDYDEKEAEVEEYQPVYETLEDPYFQHSPDRDAEARSVYEKSVSQAKKFKTIDEQVDLKSVDIKKEIIVKEEPKVTESKYARMMRNPQGLKDAIIMSEILNRKYD
jgi:hypothetical protein